MWIWRKQLRNKYIIMMLIICALLLSIAKCLDIPQFAAIQDINEVYFSYLPFIRSCNYSHTDILEGQVQIQLLDGQSFFSQIQYDNDLTFWSPVLNGLNIMMSLSSQETPYTGKILYNSPIKNFNRQIIFYTLSSNNTNLTFYYSIATLIISNMTSNISVQNAIQVQLNEESMQIMSACQNITDSNFAFIGNQTFIFVCGSLKSGFIFKAQGDQGKILNLTQLGEGSYSVVSNPTVINDPFYINDFHWNCLINSRKGPISKNFFLIYDFVRKNQTIKSIKSMQPQIKLLINRLWGLQLNKQMTKWMEIISKLKNSPFFTNNQFPGEVVSVFVSEYENIYIESEYEELNYLNVFDSSGELVWNITYSGTIVYYSNKGVYIYDKQLNDLFKVTVQRPIFKIKPPKNSSPDDQFNSSLSLTCFNTTTINFNYSLIISSSFFPMGFVNSTNSQQIYTTDTVVGFKVEDRFLIVGPDFQVIVNSPPNIQVVIIDSSTITIKTKAVAIVSVQLQYGSFASIVFATSYGIYSINSRQKIQTLSTQPCGFDAIQTVIKQDDTNTFLITNANGQQCICSQYFSQCGRASQSQAYSFISSNPRPNTNLLQKNNKKALLPSVGSTDIKKNIYTLLHEGYIISILTNNTVLVFDVNTKKVMSYILVICLSSNSVNGEVFSKEFFDPFLILYCEGSSYLFQYVLRQSTLLFQRNIPLYKFRIKSGESAISVGFSSVFIEVDPTIDVYPKPINCCVLRIDPCTFTVSAITQIVQTSSIIFVTRYQNVDIALFGIKNNQTEQCIIKAYFPSIWITLSQLDNQTMNENSFITLFFQSRNYNFVSLFQLNITFDLSSVNLTKQSSVIKSIYLDKVEGNNMLAGNISYNFSESACGPIFEFYFSRTSDNMSNVQIINNGVLTRSKILGSIGIEFLQIINPSSFSIQNCTLNDLILLISIDTMFVYNKQLQNVQMAYIGNYSLPEKHCTYYFYESINQTAASLTSNCQGLNYDYQFPLLTINYNVTFTLTYTWTVNPLNLRQIYTVVRGNNQTTLVIGLLQGPMNSATGKLFICEANVCSALYVSTKMLFLINYAAAQNGEQFLVMSIDYFCVQAYLNPLPNQNISEIKSNFTFNYSQQIDEEYCSVIKIVSFTNLSASCILSCQKYYYSLIFNFQTEQINDDSITKFARYSQCNMEDQFRPAVVLSKQNSIQVLLVVCKQNDYMFKLQTYQTINSSTPIIYTGYLQVFMINGPKGPNCDLKSVSPIKIVPLSTSMNYPLFIAYSVNGINKFIYSEINGILIDNFVSSNLSIQILYQPLSLQITYPEINLYVANPYYQISYQFPTLSQQSYSKKSVTYAAFSAFVLVNLITIVCLCCFCMRNKKKGAFPLLQMRQSNITNGGNQLHYDDNVRNAFQGIEKDRDRQTSINMSPTKRLSNRPSEIEMFFVKKK